MNKLPLFQSFVYSSSLHIIALSETWLSDKIYSKEILPSGYTIYRSDRHTRGGGVLLGVSSSLSSHLLISHSTIDLVVVQLLTSPPITLCCIYIPPSCSPDYFSSCLSALTDIITHHENVIILGDFNLPDINWPCLTSHSLSSDALCELIFEHNLTQLILKSTHSKGNILDLLITNIDHHISNLLIIPCSKQLYSDHLFIFFDLLVNHYPPHRTTSYFLDYSKGDYLAFNDYLLELDYSFCTTMDINSAWNLLKSILSVGCSRYIPKVKINSHHPPKWFNSDIRHLLNRIHSLRRRINRSPTPYLSEKLSSLELSLQDLMTSTRTQFEASLFKDYSKNSKLIHRYLNMFTSSSAIPNQVHFNDKFATSSLDKADLFNHYFHSVYTPRSFSTVSTTNSDSSPIPTISTISVQEEEIFCILSSLDPSKAMGADKIGPKLLRSCASSLCHPLTLLFQRCINLSCIPSEWKIHSITPLFKKGDPSSVTNYRPISLLCSVSKVLERLIFNHVSDHIFPHLSDKQFGFIPNRSCLQQLLSTFPLSTKTTHLTTKLTSSSSTSAKLSIPFLTIYCSTNCRTSVSLVISSIGSAHICPADLNQLLLTALFPLNSQSPQAYRKEASLAPSCLSSLSMIFQIPYNQQPLSCSQTTPSASKLSLPYTTRVYSKMTSLHSPVGALSGNSHSTAQSANC